MNFGPIGLTEIIIIVVVAILLFGARRLPKIAKDTAKMVGKARKEIREIKEDIDITKP